MNEDKLIARIRANPGLFAMEMTGNPAKCGAPGCLEGHANDLIEEMTEKPPRKSRLALQTLLGVSLLVAWKLYYFKWHPDILAKHGITLDGSGIPLEEFWRENNPKTLAAAIETLEALRDGLPAVQEDD